MRYKEYLASFYKLCINEGYGVKIYREYKRDIFGGFAFVIQEAMHCEHCCASNIATHIRRSVKLVVSIRAHNNCDRCALRVLDLISTYGLGSILSINVLFKSEDSHYYPKLIDIHKYEFSLYVLRRITQHYISRRVLSIQYFIILYLCYENEDLIDQQIVYVLKDYLKSEYRFEIRDEQTYNFVELLFDKYRLNGMFNSISYLPQILKSFRGINESSNRYLNFEKQVNRTCKEYYNLVRVIHEKLSYKSKLIENIIDIIMQYTIV